MMTIKNFVFNELGVNSYVLFNDDGICFLIDPACKGKEQQQELMGYITAHGLKPGTIILTHGHFDHVAGVAWAMREFKCMFWMHRDDLFLVKNANQHAGIFGLQVEDPPLPDRFIGEGDLPGTGNSHISVIHVPGHSPGSICLYAEKEKFIICGDVLFNGSIGRTDLLKGNHAMLISGIREKLMVLPRDTVVWPGHGPATTIGAEYDTNPFLN
jgi:glyoxylase-like metal-dependent hydrolase (beta-lactamase superfamily II)